MEKRVPERANIIEKRGRGSNAESRMHRSNSILETSRSEMKAMWIGRLHGESLRTLLKKGNAGTREKALEKRTCKVKYQRDLKKKIMVD
jgi:hypothetical protein